MEDDPQHDQGDATALAALEGLSDATERLARIRSLSDHMLSQYYSLLSDSRVITNVAALAALEVEMRSRGLPLARPQ